MPGSFQDSGKAKARSERAPAYFVDDPAEYEKRTSTEALKNAAIPLFVSRTELDLPTSITQGDALNKALCDAGRCPNYMVFKDHSHHSQKLFDRNDRHVRQRSDSPIPAEGEVNRRRC